LASWGVWHIHEVFSLRHVVLRLRRGVPGCILCFCPRPIHVNFFFFLLPNAHKVDDGTANDEPVKRGEGMSNVYVDYDENEETYKSTTPPATIPMIITRLDFPLVSVAFPFVSVAFPFVGVGVTSVEWPGQSTA
jgi:hypothetical protein